MILTETQDVLLDGLIAFGVEKDLIIGIMLMLKDEIEQYKLMYWMADHPYACAEDILERALKIDLS